MRLGLRSRQSDAGAFADSLFHMQSNLKSMILMLKSPSWMQGRRQELQPPNTVGDDPVFSQRASGGQLDMSGKGDDDSAHWPIRFEVLRMASIYMFEVFPRKATGTFWEEERSDPTWGLIKPEVVHVDQDTLGVFRQSSLFSRLHRPSPQMSNKRAALPAAINRARSWITTGHASLNLTYAFYLVSLATDSTEGRH
jgi:hypothetical protein